MYENLMEAAVEDENSRQALQAVKRPTRLSPTIRPCGEVGRCVQPPDAENRTSGGVGG